MPKKASNGQIIALLNKHHGLISPIAKELGVSYQCIEFRCRTDSELNEAKKSAYEKVIDLAESKLFQKINEGDLGAICFFLKCHGKKRGYIERGEGAVNNFIQNKVIIKKRLFDK